VQNKIRAPRWLALLLAVVLVAGAATQAWAEYYKVCVKRVDQDLYCDQRSGLFIQTRYCYEHTYGDEAILKYEPYRYDNKLIFSNGRSYDVVQVFHLKPKGSGC